MYWFKKTEKAKILQGRTIKYLAENKLFISREYLTQILNGKRGCSYTLANNIARCIKQNSTLEDYFYVKGE